MVRFHALHDSRRYIIPQCCGPLTPRHNLNHKCTVYTYTGARAVRAKTNTSSVILTVKQKYRVSVIIHRMEDIFANTLEPIGINRHSQRREPDKTPANLRV